MHEHVEDVGDRDEPRDERDRLPREPVRVAAAVPALVVRAGDPLGDREQLRVAALEHPGAEHRVGLDHLVLLRLQPPRLEQDRVRDGDLAEVVQGRRLADQPDRAVALPEVARHPGGERGDPLRVLGRVVVPVLGRQRQPVQGVEPDRLGVAERAQRLPGDDRLELALARAQLAVLEHEPQPARPGRREPAVRRELLDADDGRRRAEPERVEPLAHGGRVGVAEAEHDLRLRRGRLGRDEVEPGHEIDGRTARGGQFLAQGLSHLAVPADNQDAGAGQEVVIHCER